MPSSSQTSLSLRPRARIMLTLGLELISSEKVALIELVKNAYDADAHNVLVRLRGDVVQQGDKWVIPAGSGVVEVLDDGTGMSRDVVETIWLEPATPSRRVTRRSSAGRRVLGEKGVGRFASAKVATDLRLVTKRGGDRSEVVVDIDWDDFEDDEAFLDEIEIDVADRAPEVFDSKGAAGRMWRRVAREYFDPDGARPARAPRSTRGTYLRMSNLREAWDHDALNQVHAALARLVSPFDADATAASDFRIILVAPSELDVEVGIVQPPAELSRAPYQLDAQVAADGRAKVRMALKGKRSRKSIALVNADDEVPLRCGPFSISLRVFDRDQASLADLAGDSKRVKLTREAIDQAAGVNIYRDGFRVLPYGEVGDDWLGLDLRRVQSPTKRLSNNQIIGYVKIGRDQNPELVDQTNREGIVEGPALDDLKSAVRQLLMRLENERYDLRPRRERASKGGLLERIDLSELQQAISDRLPGDVAMRQMVTSLQVEIDDRTERVGEALAQYHRLATLGQLVDEVVHQFGQPIAASNRTLALGRQDIDDKLRRRTEDDCDTVLKRLRGRFDVLDRQVRVASDVLRRIRPLGGRRRGRPQTINLVEAVTDVIEVLRGELDRLGIRTEMPEGDVRVTIDQTELQDVVLNLLRNATYWVRRAPKADRVIRVTVERNADRSVSVCVEDSGPGVPDEDAERIFDPYFTTRDNGTGLGLSIAGSIVSDYYAGSLELLPSGDLGGALFRATFRRRIGA